MGWASRLIAFVVGLASFGAGLWVAGILCFLYLAISLRPRRSKGAANVSRVGARVPRRFVLAGGLFALSALALTSGGTLSPAMLLAAGLAVLFWPRLPVLPIWEVVPVADSILLKSKYFPAAWCALAELKPGSEAFPRALSSFAGTLLVFTNTGKAYALAKSWSATRREAEAQLLSHFKSSALETGAYLLPLESEAALDVLRVRLSRTRLPAGDLAESASKVSGILVLECGGERVLRASAYSVEGPSHSALFPTRSGELVSPPMTWEVLEAVGERTRWPDPDDLSNLLDSMTATRGVPAAEQIRTMEASEGQLTVQSLTGEKVHISRSQLRAIMSIYS